MKKRKDPVSSNFPFECPTSRTISTCESQDNNRETMDGIE